MTVISTYACRQVAGLASTVSNADGAVVGLRRRHLYGRTRHSVLSVTVQVAGPGDGRGGVQLNHKIRFSCVFLGCDSPVRARVAE